MATALTVVQPQAHIAPAFTISEIERVALAIAKGGLFGSKDPNAVLTLCLLAQAEGQHPATVFRDYHVISGKPAKKADAMLRDFINSGGKVEWHALSDEKADATFTHPSGSARIDWTMDRAKKAGLATQMWQKYPRQMLRSRVISEGIRTVYPGATSGLYVEEEVRDMVGAPPAGGQHMLERDDDATAAAGEVFTEVEQAPNDEPAGKTDLRNKWTQWAAGQAEQIKGMERSDIAEWDVAEETKRRLATCERHAPKAHARLLEVRSERLDELHVRDGGAAVPNYMAAG